jgi:hypothetical protein
MPKVQCPLCSRYVIVNEEQMIWIFFLLLLGKWQESHFSMKNLNEAFRWLPRWQARSDIFFTFRFYFFPRFNYEGLLSTILQKNNDILFLNFLYIFSVNCKVT